MQNRNEYLSNRKLKYQKIPFEKSKGIILLIEKENFTKSRHFPPTHPPHTRQQTVLLQSRIVGF